MANKNRYDISVIMPFYGVEKYIERCVRSLVGQDCNDVEFIFIDDCSPDNSYNIVKSVVGEYKDVNLRILRNETNLGVNKSRARGVEGANGKYILIVDSDDTLEDNALKVLSEMTRRNNYDIIYFDINRINPQGDGIIERYNCEPKKHSQIKHLLHFRSGGGSLCNKLIKRELLVGAYFPDNHMYEDWVVAMQCIVKAKEISYLTQPLYNYYQHDDSQMGKRSIEALLSKRKGAIENVGFVEDYLNKEGLGSQFEDDIISAKMTVKDLYFKDLKDVEGSRSWLDTFPELNKQVVCSHLPLRYKLGYFKKWIKMHS